MSELYSLSWQQVQQVFESRGWVIVGLIQACFVTLIDLYASTHLLKALNCVVLHICGFIGVQHEHVTKKLSFFIFSQNVGIFHS